MGTKDRCLAESAFPLAITFPLDHMNQGTDTHLYRAKVGILIVLNVHTCVSSKFMTQGQYKTNFWVCVSVRVCVCLCVCFFIVLVCFLLCFLFGDFLRKDEIAWFGRKEKI